MDGDDTISSDEAVSSFLIALARAIVLLISTARLVQKRPLTGPGSR